MITVGITLDNTHPAGSTPQVSQDRAYARAIDAAGAAPLLISATGEASLRRLYDACDAVCLPGGGDIAAHHYGVAPHPATAPVDPMLDTADRLLAEWALRDGKPLLGICRGQQMLNVVMGGTLWQDICGEGASAEEHRHMPLDTLAHNITVVPGSRLARWTGGGTFAVSSAHHQAIRDLAPDLVVTATAPDGIVEAVEHASHPLCVAVQFHPEVLTATQAWAVRLFRGFVADAAAQAAGKVA